MQTIRVKPATALQVRDPATAQPIPAEGAEVARNGYWLRRLAEGDVTEVKPAPVKKAKE